jgi:hypothetical protein
MNARTIAIDTALRDEFGPNFNLSGAFLYQIEDAIYDALVEYHSAEGDSQESLDDLRTQAEGLAARYESTTTQS